jgi:RHS repeat-associated protein
MAYEPFGKRRTPSGASDPGNAIVGKATDRGFTNHEHLDELGLIHMNGRVYDPAISRFMTADPSVPYPTNIQSYNRYAYTRNNPLAMIDPSGFCDRDLRSVFRTACIRSDDWGSGGGEGQDKSLQRGGCGQCNRHGTDEPKTPNPCAGNPACVNVPGKRDRPEFVMESPSLEQANQIWRSNPDPMLTVTINATKLTVVAPPFNDSGRTTGKVQGSDWFVHGTVTLQKVDGIITIATEKYNFEPHDSQPFRNIATYFGFYAASLGGSVDGNDFYFKFSGTPSVTILPR